MRTGTSSALVCFATQPMGPWSDTVTWDVTGASAVQIRDCRDQCRISAADGFNNEHQRVPAAPGISAVGDVWVTE
jgi:hypothetical protein